MAISALAQFEVRTTGVDTNGGGFVAGATGTDFSQQDAAQSSGTDLVVDATLNTKVTSATHNFVAADVGNLIQITAGAGWTTGFYQVLSVASNAATLDRSPAATSTTGGTWALGGGLATIAKALTGWVAQNIIWVKKGTYTRTTQLALTGTNASPNQSPDMILGYNVSHGDNPIGSDRPTLKWTAAVDGLVPQNGELNLIVAHFIVDGNATGVTGINVNSLSSDLGLTFVNLRVTGWTTRGILVFSSYMTVFIRCEVDSCPSGTTAAASIYASFASFYDCEVHDNACNGFTFEGQDSSPSVFVRCNAYRNTGGSSCGFSLSGHSHKCVLEGCVAYGNAGDGYKDNTTYTSISVRNCIFSQNGGYGMNTITQRLARPDIDYNFFYSNTSGAQNGVVAGAHDVTLTADPFTNASLSANGAADFSLNTTAGGGAAVRAAGYPGTSPSGNSVGHLDGGAYQHADPAGGAAGVMYNPGLDGGANG